MTEQTETERNRTPVGRPDFKSGERRQTSLVGSTPTLFRQFIFSPIRCVQRNRVPRAEVILRRLDRARPPVTLAPASEDQPDAIHLL